MVRVLDLSVDLALKESILTRAQLRSRVENST